MIFLFAGGHVLPVEREWHHHLHQLRQCQTYQMKSAIVGLKLQVLTPDGQGAVMALKEILIAVQTKGRKVLLIFKTEFRHRLF